MMEKLRMHTPDLTGENVEKIAALFPNCVTETTDESGKLTRAIDFDQLRQELSGTIVEGPQERYRLDWPGKREAILAANAPIAKTLRPCREESVDFDTTKNLFIEGDNLDALKLLQETYLGKVKLIYIDPPYNTGNDFIYEDNFAEDSDTYFARSNQKDELGNRMVANTEANGRLHSDWLSMIFPRLKMARNLLSQDGAIFVSMDDHEIGGLRLLCDEIFGGENFVATFVWQKRYSRENRGAVGDVHEYILCYARSADDFKASSGRLPLTEDQAKIYRNPNNDPRGPWRGIPMTAQGFRPNQMYDIVTPNGVVQKPPEGRCWSTVEPEFQRLKAEGRIYFGQDSNSQPQVIRYLSEVDGMTPWTWLPHQEVGHTDEAKKELYEILGKSSGFDTPKPTRLITRLLQIVSRTNDYIVLDFFAGSGTTAQAVYALNVEDGGNRRCISVQISTSSPAVIDLASDGLEDVAALCKKRIARAGKAASGAWKRQEDEDAGGAARLPGITPTGPRGSRPDTGFRVLKIDTSNMRDVYYAPDAVAQGDLLAQVDNIKPDRTPEDLLFQVLVDWGIDLALPIASESIAGKQVFFVDTNALAACFDAGLTDDMVKEIARRKPLRAVFRDASYGSDSVKINVDQIFKLLSPDTEVRSI
jgi:adenine-specific DNA-methyltransferase